MFKQSGSLVSRGWLWTALIAASVLAGVVVFNGLQVRAKDAAQLKALADKQSTVTVTVISPTSSSDAAALSLPGRIEAYAKAPLYSRISGYLRTWKADIGTSVKAGQVLAEIDTPDLDQQILQAKAELASTQANAALSENTAKRWQSLQATNFVSPQAVEEKLADLNAKLAVVNASQANVNRLQALKNFSRIVAPFDGVVTARNTDVGQLINVGGAPGSELFVVSDVKRLRLYVNLPQNQVSNIQKGTTAKFTVPEQPGQVFTATVQSMSQAISSSSGSMLVQLSAENKRGELLPGGYASVSFSIAPQANLLSVPPSALVYTKSGVQVATVNAENRVVMKPVVIARDHGNRLELLSGIQAQDKVIENPPDGVTQGDLVQVRTPQASH
ncbi:MAG: efflux RND transporter periplasmic adaptor subunit [Betaproteobacteria bacterium]|jgi:RND family efflux transporter MFP subunit|nr:efflux RND transporter periplasmic adaptor subunit [Betaproteobacteria bacterium]NDG14907.1 efflux RND transporter periplasmic adaptor subunit [Betaproteobacteria bacterium]